MAVGLAAQRWQDAVESFDETVGRLHKLNSAERRCLSFVCQQPQTASAIAKEIALTPAAVTSLVDRLERRGLVLRRRDDIDRRKVLVEASDRTRELVRATYSPIAKAGAELLSQYSLEELTAIARYLEDARALQLRMIERLTVRQPNDRSQ